MVFRSDCVHRFVRDAKGTTRTLALSVTACNKNGISGLFELKIEGFCGEGIELVGNSELLSEQRITGSELEVEKVLTDILVEAFKKHYRYKQFKKVCHYPALAFRDSS
jgi:hypothetical protein